MTNSVVPFGRRALETRWSTDLLRLEIQEGQNARFKDVDVLVGDLLLRSIRGERIASLGRDAVGDYHVELLNLPRAQRTYVDDTYAVERQRARGALFLPAKVSLKVGIASLPFAFTRQARFPCNVAQEEKGQVILADAADAVVFWSVLEPLFQALYLPITLRSQWAGKRSREEQQALWSDVDAFHDALALDAREQLAVMRYGGGWHTLRAEAQAEERRSLLAMIRTDVNPIMGSRARAHFLRPLLQAYYKKSKAGKATRRQVLTKALEPLLVGYFGGDWLAFLDYLGETPHPDEQVVTALPETRLFVSGGSRVAEVAEIVGLPAEEVQNMLAAFWSGGGGDSPIEQRVKLLRRYWQMFDAIHAEQKPGMMPLWGLVSEERFLHLNEQPSVPYHHGLYRDLLAPDLVDQIEQLWGTTMLSRWPDGIVTELYPHTAMAEALGPALRFWHGCSLTAWFLCEGPYSRTDMAGLAQYHRRELNALEGLGTPVVTKFFDELIEAEKMLGPAQPINENIRSTPTSFGAITMSVSHGSRRMGFERLRDIISRHRRAWTERHFEMYLRSRWEKELRQTAHEHAILMGQKGKAPTLKQFAKPAAPSVNHWFGGDISKLYTAIGEKSPCAPRYNHLMPKDILGLTHRTARGLETKLSRPYDVAVYATWYIQLQETLGHAPGLNQFGRGKLTWPAEQEKLEVEQLWQAFVKAVELALRSD